MFLDDFQRIDTITEGFTHLPALAVPHDAVNKDRLKRALVHDFVAKHDHARHPEEDDVIARDKRAGRIEILQLLRLFRIAERGKWPHAGAEPCIQHIFVLTDWCTTVRALVRFLFRDDHLAAGVAIVGRNPVSPPELA
ncbi:hypothetical protein SDC9_122021 [bioreactor metagenome]|uniref:Uncharacterized protein n=1 Tax=bioreactor metagenome TaxID=1076179 RepID=A0A645CDN2_9ZZZZ